MKIDTNCYWDNTGIYESLSKKLEALIPDSGAVPNPKKNRMLERFRVASNCYYDLYNNGLYNRAAEFRKVFGFGSKVYRTGTYGHFSVMMYSRVEAEMDGIVLAAALEQFTPDEMKQTLTAVVDNQPA